LVWEVASTVVEVAWVLMLTVVGMAGVVWVLMLVVTTLV
jgi:hypothetical protein